ncbi:MAG: hypothetical protein CVV02_05270 [Firmicutes bacterium HGW-Firmicutes-7]|nr:MAG: hypothetical protein CVV02_05270 [Firmicutes bacterium HGW-Firmicutes-7]
MITVEHRKGHYRMKLMKKKKPIIAGAIMLIIVAIIVATLKPKTESEDDVIWREYMVTYNDITASLDGGGTLESTGTQHSLDVALKLEQLTVEVGQYVKKGEVLAHYAKVDLESQIEKLNLSLNSAHRTLEDVNNNKIKTQLQNNMSSDEAFQNSKRQYETKKKEINKAIVGLEKTINHLLENIDSLKQKLRQAEVSEDGSTDSIELKKLKEELVKLKKELSSIEDSTTSNNYDSQIFSLEQQRSNIRTQLKDVKKQISTVSDYINSVSNLKAELASVQKQIAMLEGDDPQLLELIGREAELKSEIASTKDESGKLTELISQKKSLEQQIDDLDSQIDSLEDTASDAKEMKKLQTKISNVQDKISAFSSKEEKIASLNEQIKQANEDLNDVTLDRDNQKEALDDLEHTRGEQVNQENSNQSAQNKIDGLMLAGLDNAIENAKVEVGKIQSDIEEAKAILKNPVLMAKVDGVITAVNFSEGDEVPTGKSVVTIGEDGEKSVVTQISQEDISTVEVGQIVEMYFLAFSDVALKGKVLSKSYVPTSGSDSVIYKVTIVPDEADVELLEGMTCNVKFILKRVEHVLTLSNKAISLQDGRQYVTVLLSDGSHEQREIITGFSDGRVSEVKSGLSDGDIVVVKG